MNFALLLPAGLAALAALLLPVLIHLARRSERRPTDFAALRWLQAQARPRRNVRFDELLLLALRLLLIAALALLLAKPVLRDASDATPWVVALPGVDVEALRIGNADKDEDEDQQRRWLAPGFPEASEASLVGRMPVGSLLRELDALLPADAPLTVLVPGIIDGADAERPLLSRRVEWRIVSAAASRDAGKKSAARIPGMKATMPALVVRHAPERAPSLRYLRAATAAWRVSAASPAVSATDSAQARATDIAETTTAIPADAKLLVWLAPGPLPDALREWIEAGGTVLLDAQAQLPGLDAGMARWRDANGDVLVRGIALGRGQALQWTRAMTPEAMPALLEADFPQRLRTLFTGPPPAPARVTAAAYAPLAGGASWPEAPRELAPWLALLIAVLFLIERWLASSARRRASA